MKRFLREYLNCGASQYAGMLAFSLFVAMLPLTLGLLTLWGFLTRSPRRFFAAKEVLVDIFPAVTQSAVRQVILGAGEHAGTVALLSIAGLLWFSTGVFSTTGFALNRIHRLPDRSLVQQRLRGLWLPLPLIGAVYLAVAVNLAVRRWPVPGVLGPVASWAALTWLIGFLYARAPSRPLRRVDVFPGAGLAAAVMVGLAYAFPLYAQLSAHLSSGTEFFTVVFGLVAWVYCIAHVVLLGAVFNQSRMAARSQTSREAPAAAVIDPGGPT